MFFFWHPIDPWVLIPGLPHGSFMAQVPVALPTSSGASALHVALLACNLGPQERGEGRNQLNLGERQQKGGHTTTKRHFHEFSWGKL